MASWSYYSCFTFADQGRCQGVLIVKDPDLLLRPKVVLHVWHLLQQRCPETYFGSADLELQCIEQLSLISYKPFTRTCVAHSNFVFSGRIHLKC